MRCRMVSEEIDRHAARAALLATPTEVIPISDLEVRIRLPSRSEQRGAALFLQRVGDQSLVAERLRGSSERAVEDRAGVARAVRADPRDLQVSRRRRGSARVGVRPCLPRRASRPVPRRLGSRRCSAASRAGGDRRRSGERPCDLEEPVEAPNYRGLLSRVQALFFGGNRGPGRRRGAQDRADERRRDLRDDAVPVGAQSPHPAG